MLGPGVAIAAGTNIVAVDIKSGIRMVHQLNA
jgi:hypothetical protein